MATMHGRGWGWLCALALALVTVGCSEDASPPPPPRVALLSRLPIAIAQDGLSDTPSSEFVAARTRVIGAVSKSQVTHARGFVIAPGRGAALVSDVDLTRARRSAATSLGAQLDSDKEQDAALAQVSLDVLLAELQRRAVGASTCDALGDKADDCVVVLLILEVKRCERGEVLDAATPADGAVDSGGLVPDGGTEDARTPTADAADGVSDAAQPEGDAGPAAQISALAPASVEAGSAVTLAISGTGFAPAAVAYVDGQRVPSTLLGTDGLQATIAASMTQNPGDLAVFVENTPGDARTRSNTLYLRVQPAPGAPIVHDYSPDNGLAGDKVLIIGSNLQDANLMVRDANGLALTRGALGSISWPNVGSVSSLELTLPTGIATGPLTVTSSLGSFRGKIFNVGQNLTRLPGTEITSSTQYNTSNWSRLSGADNDLRTSFFTAYYDCTSSPSCTSQPWFRVTFASPQTVRRIAMRGNREYAAGYDFLRGRFEIAGAEDAVLWYGFYDLPEPDRDIDIALPASIANARSVAFFGLADQSLEPGFSELEVFGP